MLSILLQHDQMYEDFEKADGIQILQKLLYSNNRVFYSEISNILDIKVSKLND